MLSPLSSEGVACVCEAVIARKEQIREAMLRETLMSTRRLIDFDWNVRVSYFVSLSLSLSINPFFLLSFSSTLISLLILNIIYQSSLLLP